MRTVTENINRITKAKSDIKKALENKGVDVGDVTIDKYADKINQISSGDKPINVFSGLDLEDKELDLMGWDYPTGMKSLSGMFKGLPVRFIGVAYWDTEVCEDMSEMFSTMLYLEDCKGFDMLNTSNVTNMSGLFMATFMRCDWDLYNTKWVAKWDTSKVQDMSYLFADDIRLLGLDISGWEMSSVHNASDMFRNCNELTTLSFGSGLKVSLNLSDCSKLSVESLLSVLNGIANVRGLATKPVLTLGSTNLAKLTDNQKAIATNKGWTLA